VGTDLFLSHAITRAPDIDQTLAVRVVGDGPTADELRQGLQVVIRGRTNVVTERLRAGERVTGQVMGGSDANEVELEVLSEIYVEEGELRDPHTFDPTPEEIAARMP
jgi:hypothetical protein